MLEKVLKGETLYSVVCGSWNATYGKCHKLGVEPWLSDWKERQSESQRSGCIHQEESFRK